MQVKLNAENVVASIDGPGEVEPGLQLKQLTLTIELEQNSGLTSTGKSVMIAKTGGWQTLDIGGVRYKLNLNLVRPVRQGPANDEV